MSEYFVKYYGQKIANELAGIALQPTFTLEEVLRELHYGRTAVNFGHVPEVSRAIDWLTQDFRKLAKERQS